VEWPIKSPEAFKRLGIRAPRGILLYGPPGTGKTLLAKAVAKESESNFINVKGPSLLSMWVGKSEEGVRKIFERARQVSPCVIFFDEIDALAGRRGLDAGNKVTERVLNQLLAEVDGLEGLKDVTIIGATNRPDMLDPALLRPGRFDRVILVDVPDAESRKKIFEVHLKNTPLAKDIDMVEMVKLTEGFVGADIESLVREAAMNALRKDMSAKEVTRADFDDAMMKVKPSVSVETAKRYKKLEELYLKQVKAGIEVGPLYTG
ncbi:MAG: AAA family ATPase, partial [Nanoarchaeota archaeon]|nr:AAA family ATPase [Nanoarchaeota archaeon]